MKEFVTDLVRCVAAHFGKEAVTEDWRAGNRHWNVNWSQDCQPHTQ